MTALRIIPRLDIKGPNLIKSIRFEGLRKMGPPQEFAHAYYKQGADELLFNDNVASLYGRNSLLDIIRETAENIFIPLTVGGGISSVEGAKHIFRAGADKISINSGAIKNETLISELAEKFGSQAIVVEVQAKKSGNTWEALYENGREHSHKNAIEWAMLAEQLGAGELLITSVDQEGTQLGFDNELIKQILENVSVPVIASGGMGGLNHLDSLLNTSMPSAIAVAHVLHYKEVSITEIKKHLAAMHVDVRL